MNNKDRTQVNEMKNNKVMEGKKQNPKLVLWHPYPGF